MSCWEWLSSSSNNVTINDIETSKEVVVKMSDGKETSLPGTLSSNAPNEHSPAHVDASYAVEELPKGMELASESAEGEIDITKPPKSELGEAVSMTQEQSSPQTDCHADLKTDLQTESTTQPPQDLQTRPPTEPQPNPQTKTSTATPDPHGEPNGPKQKRPRATFEKAVNLPDETATDLTNEQILSLIPQGPSVRRKYMKYFFRNGSIRHEHRDLVLSKTPSGEFRFPEAIIKSNITKWSGSLDTPTPRASTSYSTGRKQATRKTPTKRASAETSDAKAPPKKRAKKVDLTQSDNEPEPTGKSRDRSVGISKPIQRSDVELKATATAMGSLSESKVTQWLKDNEADDLGFPGDSKLLHYMLWMDPQLRAMHYSLTSTFHVDTSKNDHMLRGVLKGLTDLQRSCKKLADHLKSEIINIKGKYNEMPDG